jgi:hypothetical protein
MFKDFINDFQGIFEVNCEMEIWSLLAKDYVVLTIEFLNCI